MDVMIEALIPFEKIEQAPNEVFRIVEKYGQAVLLKNNTPAYIITKPRQTGDTAVEPEGHQQPVAPAFKESSLTLQEAMRIVLMDAKDHQMHASELADVVYERGLYMQKNGEKAKYNQIRARCGHYPEMFEALKGNNIRLRTENPENSQ